MANEGKAAKPKLLYKVEFWQENREQKPVLVRYVRAYSSKHAYVVLRERALQEARTQGDYMMAHMFVRDDILVVANEVKEDPLKTQMKREFKNYGFCPKCSHEVEDDYCQNCGWHKGSSWLDRAEADKGQ